MTTRRDFLKTTAGAAALGLTPGLARAAEHASRPAAPLSILVLGGTGFIGPHLVRHAVSRGHKLTIFTRGRRDGDLPPDVVRLVGDRDGKLQALEEKRWDAVIDDSGNRTEWVRQSTQLLKNSTGAYLFTSSTGVYYPYLKRGLNESDPVLYAAPDPNDGSATFGVMKSTSERLTLDTFGTRGIVVRPTYIVGPGDTSDRFPYWPRRLVRGGEVLAPGKRDDLMQIIDVRDLAEFMVKLLEENQNGVYNVAGPRTQLTARVFYESAVKALDAKAQLTYVDDYEFLSAHKIEEAIPWAMLKGNDYGMMSIKNDKAIAAGLGFRPLATTVRDTLAWWEKTPARHANPRFTIKPEQETQALAEWHKKGR